MVFEIKISKNDMKFSCAHFIAYNNYREKLHGHNYNLTIRLTGTELSKEGYLIDFGVIKQIARELCKSLNERFICPSNSDVLQIEEINDQINITCQDGSFFSFPKDDCILLPICHSSSEELAHYLYCEVIRRIGLNYLLERSILELDIGIIEVQDQEAHFRQNIPQTDEEFQEIINQFQRNIVNKPCKEKKEKETMNDTLLDEDDSL